MKTTEEITITEPATDTDWQQYYALRYQVLRQPWQQPEGSEKLPDDSTSYHALLKDKAGVVRGVARLHLPEPGTGQLRMMAVHPDSQGKGYGRLLVEWIEEKAARMGARKMVLEAREQAVPFYDRLGYKITGKSYLLFGQIQHFTMAKDLNKKQPATESGADKALQWLSPQGVLLLGGIAVAGATIFLLSTFRNSQKALLTVAEVNLQRYIGLWYEIARYPNRFEKNCHCVTAQYSLHPDGYVRVVNSCYKNGPKGEPEVAEGKAFVVEGSNNTKLRVQFQWPFRGDYWIIDLAEDYRFAVVSEPGREYLWILSRTPQMLHADYEAILQRLKKRGFDLSTLIVTDQSCFPKKQFESSATGN